MNKFFLIFSHRLTEQQILDAKSKLGIKEFIYLPRSLQEIWSQIAPEFELPINNLNKILEFLQNKSKNGDYVLVQGDFGATYYLVSFCFKNNLIPVYSTTKRIIVEEKNVEGKTLKTNMFEHVGFRKYLEYI